MAFFCINCKREIDPSLASCPYCGEPVTDFLREYLQRPIDGKYEILSRIGIGGMGEVFKVLHIHLNAVRVIKLMRPSISGDNSLTDRFVREARLATRIHHRNVATLHDFSTLPDGSWYMVWEYIEGTTITEMIRRRGRLSAKYAAEIGEQALLGLDAIHRAGIVHRDVSPDNIMISRGENGEEEVKIIDLGIAKQEDDSVSEQTKTGMFIGKWKYCSPEHLGLLKPGERIDGRADVYSFGLVMYEMLTGSAPFVTTTPQQYIFMHARETPKAMSVLVPSMTVSPELEAVIFHALEKDREKRFQSAREFAQELQRLIPTLDSQATTASQTRSAVTAPPTPVPTVPYSSQTARDGTGSTRAVQPPGQTVRDGTGSTRAVQPPGQTVRDGTGSTRAVLPPGQTTGATQARAGSSTRTPTPAPFPAVLSPTTGARPMVLSGTTTERETPLASPGYQPPVKSKRGLLIAGILVVLIFGALVVGAVVYFGVRYAQSQSSTAPQTSAVTATATIPQPSTAPTVTTTPPVTTAPPSGETVVVSTSPAIVTAVPTRLTAVTTTVATRPPTATVAPVHHPQPSEQPPPPTYVPENQPSSTVAPEPVHEGIGSKFGHVLHHFESPSRFMDSTEAKEGFRRGIIPDYGKLAGGEKVQWSWLEPGFKLSDHKLVIGRFQGLAGINDQHAIDRLTHEITQKLTDKTSDASGGLVIGQTAVFWESDGSRKGVGIEMVFREASTRKVVALIRHTEAKRSVDSAIDAVVEAVSDYVDDH